jgi:hypothetical protein
MATDQREYGEQFFRLTRGVHAMPEEIIAILARIEANQGKLDTIIANQSTIIENQSLIKSNQEKLDRIIANQEAIQANQAKILTNQTEIISRIG